jgi:hypothetical protein
VITRLITIAHVHQIKWDYGVDRGEITA